MAPKILIRKIHYWLSVGIALPLAIIIVSGLLLQLKKESAWIQPPTQRGSADVPALPFADILAIARGVPEAAVTTWADIDRLDIRPDRGVIKVRCANRWEVQLDHSTGAILQIAERRSDLIESIHDGSFFHGRAKLGIFLPTAAGLLVLWITGMYLFILPLWSKRQRRRERPAASPS